MTDTSADFKPAVVLTTLAGGVVNALTNKEKSKLLLYGAINLCQTVEQEQLVVAINHKQLFNIFIVFAQLVDLSLIHIYLFTSIKTETRQVTSLSLIHI